MKFYLNEFRNVVIQFIILVSLSFLLHSCFTEIDDTGIVYTKDFTVLKGRIVTENGTKPVKGMKLNLDFEIHGEISGTHRNIRNFETDSNGYFNINFYPTDNEIKYHSGSYRFKCIGTYPQYGLVNNEYILGIVFLNKRDTVIEKTYLLPTDSYLKVIYPSKNDTIQSRVWYNWGDMNSPYFGEKYRMGYASFYTLSDKEYLYVVAGNQMNYIDISRRYTSNTLKTDSIYVQIGDTAVYRIKL